VTKPSDNRRQWIIDAAIYEYAERGLCQADSRQSHKWLLLWPLLSFPSNFTTSFPIWG
jgi:hypothetical protein